MITACESNPDQWFPTMPQGGDRVSPKRFAKIEAVVAQTREAIALCNVCPGKQACLEIGMQREHVENGIWGGLMAGERMALSGMWVGEKEVRLMALLDVVPKFQHKKQRQLRDNAGKSTRKVKQDVSL